MTYNRRKSDRENPCNVVVLATEIRQLRLELALAHAKLANMEREKTEELQRLYSQLTMDLFG